MISLLYCGVQEEEKYKKVVLLSCFCFDCVYNRKRQSYMRESGDEKSTLRQIEKIKALSEDMLEYQAIDVHKAWQSMERRAKRKAL